MGKGSRPRPYSVSISQFDANYDLIFGKKSGTSVPEPQLSERKVTCGCGRSPTGNCIGWHGLSEEAFQERLAEYQAQHK